MANNHKNNHKRRKIWWGVAAIILVGGASAIATALRPNHSIDPSKLAAVERGDIARSVVATGKIEPLAKVEVKSKASGIVKELFVDYGDHVKKGQVLAELDKEQLRARVEEARATLQGAQASQLSAKAVYARNVVEAEGPDVPFLRAELERNRKLAAAGLIAPAVLDEADKAYQMGLNMQHAAKRNVAVSLAEVARAKAQVAQAQAALDSAQEDLRNATIVSPMDGIVLSRDVEVGDAVSSILVLGSQATRLFTLGDISEVYVLGKVDEADVGKIYVGQPARIVVESFKNQKFQGQVTKIAPMGVEKDNVTTFEVRVSIKNPGEKLRANMTANAEIIEQEKKNALLVPEAAVVYDKERKTFLEVPDPSAKDGRRKIAAKIGISNGVKAELEGGLKVGDKVILQ